MGEQQIGVGQEAWYKRTNSHHAKITVTRAALVFTVKSYVVQLPVL
jgi:hypothetical protein